MGRKRVDLIRNAFEYDGEAKKSVCRNCGKLFFGSHVTNLRRHLHLDHPEILSKIEEENSNAENESDVSTKKRKIQIEMSEEQIIDSCIDFITTEARPLKFLDSPSLRSILNPIFIALKMDVITSRNIMTVAEKKLGIMTNDIKKMCRKKIISLKIDAATRHNRSLFCVNLQTIQGKKIIVKTLGIVTMDCRQTAQNIKAEIKKILARYEINLDQIYSITSDNGRNMIKAVELIGQEEYDYANDDDGDNYENNVEINSFLENIENLNLGSLQSVRCAAHVLQLVVVDFFKNSNTEEILNKSRYVVKLLRTPTHRYSLSDANLKKPIIDVPTRWSSAYDMLHRLLELKSYCNTHCNHISEEVWVKIEDLIELLKPVKFSTLRLQQEQLTLGDFVKLWWELRLQIQSQTANSVMANILFKCLESREKLLLESPVVLAAIYLDPRTRKLLPPEKEIVVKKHLRKLALQMQKIKNVSSFHNQQIV